MSAPPATDNDDTQQWTFGPFFEAHLKSPAEPLPDWNYARQHFGPLFAQLHLKYIPELMAATKTTPPPGPVFPSQGGAESQLAYKRRMHLVNVYFFYECCAKAMKSMSEHDIHFDWSTLPKVIRLILDDVPRLYVVLNAIRDICDPPAPAPVEKFTRVPISALFHGAKLAERAQEEPPVHRGTTPTESELFNSSDEDEEILRVTGPASRPSSPSLTEMWEANQEEAYRPSSPEYATPPDSDRSSDLSSDRLDFGPIGSGYKKKAHHASPMTPSSPPSLSPISSADSVNNAGLSGCAGLSDCSAPDSQGMLSPDFYDWPAALRSCDDVFRRYGPEGEALTSGYYNGRKSTRDVRTQFDRNSTYVDPEVLLALDQCEKERVAREKLEKEEKIRKMADQVTKDTQAIMERNRIDQMLMEVEHDEEKTIELINSLRRELGVGQYVQEPAARQDQAACPDQC